MTEAKFWSPNSNLGQQVKSPMSKFSKPKKLPKWLVITFTVSLIILFVGGIISYFAVYRPAMAVLKQVNVVRDDVKAAREAMVKRDLVTLEKVLQKTEVDLKDLQNARDDNFGWAKNFGFTKDYYSDSDHFINSGVYGIDAARETMSLITPFADAAGLRVSEEQETKDEVSILEAFTTWISVMPEVANNIDGVLVHLDKVGKELSNVDPTRYPESIRGMEVRANIERAQSILGKVQEYAPDIKQALQIFPGLMGVETGEKRYMIIMQNDKEIRATGGFWTNYATFRINNGQLVNNDISSRDMYSIDIALNDIDAYYTFPKAPASYNKYLRVERLYARDANISPDFPTAVDQFMVFYKLAMPLRPNEIKPIDGIIAIDTEVVKEMMEVTGPVTINGVTYTPDNVVLELERLASLTLAEQSNRKGILGTLMNAMLKNVFESDKNLWTKLIDKGIDLAIRKHIVAYSFDPQAQSLLEKYNIAGRIVDPVEGDYSFIVSTNLGGDKTNWFVNRNIEHTLTKEGDKWLRTVKVSYDYPQPSVEYGPFVKRFRDWLRVYAPLGSEFVGIEGSEDGSVSDQERNKAYYTGYIELGPGESKSMTFKYYIPENVVGKDGTYDLYLQKQSGTNGEKSVVIVNGRTSEVDLKTDYKFSTKL